MKKLFLTCLFTALISILFGNYIFSSYKKSIENIIAASTSSEKVYMILYGSYNSLDKVNNLKIENYILENENGYYKVYVGVTFYLENANKIREIYKENGNSIYIKEKYINNLEFIDYLMNKDSEYLNLSNDEILSRQKDIISKYKELFNE